MLKPICENCRKRKGRVLFAREPYYAITHNVGRQWICRQCYISKIEAELIMIKDNLKKQKRLLRCGR